MKKRVVFFLLFFAPLMAASCFQSPPPPVQNAPQDTETPTLLGEVSVTFTLDQVQAASQVSASSSTLTLTPVSSQLADDNGTRYLYGTFRVTNTSANDWKNLTFYALNHPASLGGTAVLEMADETGEALVDPLLARTILPAQHTPLPDIPVDFQAFAPQEAADVQTLGGFSDAGKTVLHYGYVATAANGTRTTTKNETGLVTIAVAYPYHPDEAQVYPTRFTLAFAVATQPKTTLSHSEGLALCERASAIAASEIIVVGKSNLESGCAVTRLNDIKTAVASGTLPEAFLLTPATPRQLSSHTITNAVALSWEDNLEADLQAYRLYRDGALIYEGTETAFIDSGLNNGQNYSYTVSAVDVSGYVSALSTSLFVMPQGSGAQPIWLEAETASGGANFSPWQVFNDSNAGAGKYTEVRTGSASNNAPPTNGEASYTFTLGEAGDYVVWARAIAATTAKDSLWVSIDAGPWIKWNGIDRSSTWLWDQVHNSDNANQTVLFSLAAGPHTLNVRYRELNTKVDKFHITKDLSFIPSGQGGAHNDGTGSGDTTPPAVPTGLSATPGNAQVALSWNANSEGDLGGYRLYRDGVQVYQGPALSFNDTGLTNNQTYSYTLAAYDTSGNISAQSAPVNATPTSPPGPSTPTGLAATAGVGQVQLTWNANSESNLAGYRLYRNGLQIYQGTAPSHLDSGLSGGATYSYSVSAFDTSANESAQSSALVATVKYAVLHHLIGNGQSVMGGSQSTPILTTTQAFDTKMFSSIRKATNLTALNPLVEQAETFFARPHGETIASGMTAQIRAAASQPLLFSVDFTNGSTIAGLDKGSASYNGTLAQVAAGETFAANYKVSAINWIQGGGDIEANTSYTTYKNLLQSLYSDYIADIAASSGQTENPIMLVGQISHWTAYNKTTSPIPIAQLQATRDTAGMYLVGPEYPYARVADGIHYTNHSQRWYGSQFGKVYDRIVRQGIDWRPLEPTSLAFDNNDIVVNFHVPVGPLVWDTTLVSNPGNYGFEIFNDTTDTNITINTPVIEGSSVRITPSSPLQNGHSYRLRIAYSGTSGNAGGPTTGPRSNLRDSDSAVGFYTNASGTPYPLHNWAVTVDELIGTFTGSGDTTPPATPTGLTATPGNTQVQLTWSANNESDLAGYRLYRDGTLVYTGTTPSRLDTGLNNGTTYTYTVAAYDTSGNESAPSSGVPATPTGGSNPALAIRFDESASPSQYFTIADNAALTLPNGDWAVGFWAKVSSNQGTVTKYVLSTGAWGGAGSFNIMLGETGNTSFSNKWVARIQSVQLASSSAPGGDGTWRLVIVQRRGTQFQLYFAGINGAPTLQASANVGTLGSMNGGNWIMGGRADFGADRFFGGDLAEAFMGNFSLTTNEITQLASGSTVIGIGKSPLFYHSVVQSGTTLLDQSGNGHNATQSGSPVTAPHPFQ